MSCYLGDNSLRDHIRVAIICLTSTDHDRYTYHSRPDRFTTVPPRLTNVPERDALFIIHESGLRVTPSLHTVVLRALFHGYPDVNFKGESSERITTFG
jgi:hypothetical protein